MLKLSASFGIAAASLLALSAAPAVAAPFTASYDFGGPATTGDVFSFDFEGVVNGNLIEGVSSLSNFSFGGVPIFDPDDAPPFGGGLSVVSGVDVLSFDGLENFFQANNDIFSDLIFFAGEAAFFQDVSDGGALFGGEVFSSGRWSVGPSATPIPTPALLPGLLGMGIAQWRKRNLAQSSEA